MVQIVEMNDQEKFEMYDKLSKKEIIDMLIEANRHLDKVKVSYVPMQACPICNGKGMLENYGISTALSRNCDYCNGAKAIPMHVLR